MPTDLTPVLCDDIDEFADDLVELTQALIRINTVNPYAGAGPTGLEGDGQEHLRPIMEKLGAKTHLFEPPPDIYRRVGVLGPKGRQWKGRPNLVSVFDLGPGPTIVINSHMDTVGVEGMTFDPFAARLEAGTIYGRGATDDKGGMATGVTAIRAILKHAERFAGTIVHQSVVDEECNGAGAGTLACCDRGFLGDEAIVLDGDSLHIMHGCQGVLTADLHVNGRSGHAAHGGISAIDKGMIVKQGIDRFSEQRTKRYPDCLVNLGIFHAGVHPAVVAGSARLSLNLVYHIQEAADRESSGHGWNGSAVREMFEEQIRWQEGTDPWLTEHPTRIEWIKDLVPFETPRESPLVEGLAKAYASIRRSAPQIGIMSAWADGANLSRYGDTPSVLMGPATAGKAHSDDESVEVRDLIDGAKIVAAYLAQRLAK